MPLETGMVKKCARTIDRGSPGEFLVFRENHLLFNLTYISFEMLELTFNDRCFKERFSRQPQRNDMLNFTATTSFYVISITDVPPRCAHGDVFSN